ncbi:MAG: alkane 1-monooxygenase [Sulfuritalea sp.]|jgi:alkane 1-monooxygenase|nr:alkane 1-monooxygenase [Sulfuritalea sp.]MBP6637403.1 alkane 1-monooxygenase [Sulfuritalea sp.]MBP7422118.1 alkane 1-monooxygenase [Sulfuritalea sp.]
MPVAPFDRHRAWFILLQFFSLPVIGWWLGTAFGAAWLCNLLTPFWVFMVFPQLDAWIGLDTRNPAAESEAALAAEPSYRLLPLAALPAHGAMLAWSAPAFVALGHESLTAALALALSVGIIGGAIGITFAHELIHKPTSLERNVGGVLLSLVAYGGFKVEHIFGHHVDVATPRDTSTARLGQSAYAFLLRSLLVNPPRAWQLAGERLRARGLPAWHWRNEMYRWHGLTLLFATGITAWLGIMGLAFFVLQAFVAITLLELVNYIEHYGLLRRQRPDGSYERVTPRHSWNDSHYLSNLALLNLQRHSDHHAYAGRRYQVLRHHDDAPQLPCGYASLVLLALLPPLWRRFMDPRVAAWKAAEAG